MSFLDFYHGIPRRRCRQCRPGPWPVHPASHALHKTAPPRNAPRRLQKVHGNCYAGENGTGCHGTSSCCICFLWGVPATSRLHPILVKKTPFLGHHGVLPIGFTSLRPLYNTDMGDIRNQPLGMRYAYNGIVPNNMIFFFCWQKWASVQACPKLLPFWKLMMSHEFLEHLASFIRNPHYSHYSKSSSNDINHCWV